MQLLHESMRLSWTFSFQLKLKGTASRSLALAHLTEPCVSSMCGGKEGAVLKTDRPDRQTDTHTSSSSLLCPHRYYWPSHHAPHPFPELRNAGTNDQSLRVLFNLLPVNSPLVAVFRGCVPPCVPWQPHQFPNTTVCLVPS